MGASRGPAGAPCITLLSRRGTVPVASSESEPGNRLSGGIRGAQDDEESGLPADPRTFRTQGELRLRLEDSTDVLLPQLHDLATPCFPKEMVDRGARHLDRHIEGRRLLGIARDGGTRDKDQTSVRRECQTARRSHQQVGSVRLDEHGGFDRNLRADGLARLPLPLAVPPPEPALRRPEVQVVQAALCVEKTEVHVGRPQRRRFGDGLRNSRAPLTRRRAASKASGGKKGMKRVKATQRTEATIRTIPKIKGTTPLASSIASRLRYIEVPAVLLRDLRDLLADEAGLVRRLAELPELLESLRLHERGGHRLLPEVGAEHGLANRHVALLDPRELFPLLNRLARPRLRPRRIVPPALHLGWGRGGVVEDAVRVGVPKEDAGHRLERDCEELPARILLEQVVDRREGLRSALPHGEDAFVVLSDPGTQGGPEALDLALGLQVLERREQPVVVHRIQRRVVELKQVDVIRRESLEAALHRV